MKKLQDKNEKRQKIIKSIFQNPKKVTTKDNVFISKLNSVEKTFYQNEVMVTAEEAEKICIDTVLQNDHNWKLERKKRITGSTGYSLFTIKNPQKYDWPAKVNSHINPTFQGNKYTEHGRKCEEPAIKLYERLLRVNVMPWLGYSPDGIVDGEKLLEIKSPVNGKKMKGAECLDAIICILVMHLPVLKKILKKTHKSNQVAKNSDN